MKSNILLAWRNLWRNKRRTLITVASVFFGVLLSTLMTSMQEGSYSSMIDNIVKFYSGYIQIQHEAYWDNKTINNTMTPTGELFELASSVREVTHTTTRLESFALASSETLTRGSLVIGIDPDKENKITELTKWVIDGTYFRPGDDGVLIGSELARYLKIEVGDTLVMIGAGYHGVSAAGKYPVRGILKFPNPELNKQTVYMELSNCQNFFSAENLVSSMIIMVDDQYDLKPAMKELKAQVKSPYTVMSWDEMHPELLQMVEGDRAGGTVIKAILYILIGFGIFGTVMMMVAERTREMGVMVAIGMQKIKLAGILFFETVFIGLIGVLAGFAGSIPLITWFYTNPVKLSGNVADTMIEMGLDPYMYFSWLPSVFYNQVITVFVMTAIVAIYPLFMAVRLKVHLALRA
ncbi:MAG: ABC transporter permease [Cytophagales bacterium]|nr:ABC transporter permease [Cytophagales bacterium]